ncbi:MAG: TIGR03557 family F420-dependent LLM class oxidoreductase [Nitrososphaerota archaeon]
MSGVRVGIVLASEEYSPNELVRQGVEAERNGLDVAWGSDHFHPWFDTAAHGVFIWSILSSLGTLTKKIVMGTSVTCPLFRYPPPVVAQAFSTMQNLFPGRMFLGVGTGEALNEVPCGFSWPPYRERLERLEEAVFIIRLLWHGKQVTYHGKYYSLNKAKLYDPPPINIPVHIASSGARGARLAGMLADAFMTLPVDDHTIYTQRLFPAIDRGAREVGRSGEDIEKSLLIHVGFDEQDYEKALKSLLPWRGTLLPIFFDLNVYDPRYIEMHGNRVSEKIVEDVFLVATGSEEVIRYLERYLKLGFRHIAFSVSGDPVGFIKTLGKKVAPWLREVYGEVQAPYQGGYTREHLQKYMELRGIKLEL